MKLVPYMRREDLLGAIFVNAPADEPLELSLSRLARAITADGLSAFYSPMSVWHAYTHHPTLSQDYKQLMEDYRNERSKRTAPAARR